jgi:hypothetical protein
VVTITDGVGTAAAGAAGSTVLLEAVAGDFDAGDAQETQSATKSANPILIFPPNVRSV